MRDLRPFTSFSALAALPKGARPGIACDEEGPEQVLQEMPR